MIFHQVENDGVVDREVIPMEHERVRYSLISVCTNSKSSLTEGKGGKAGMNY